MISINKRKKAVSVDNLTTIFSVAGEMIRENGEDSYYYAATRGCSIVAVFDGCGGIGSRRYENYSGKTGAYVASRAVCGGVKGWFEDITANADTLYDYIKKVLGICDAYADRAGRMRGSLGGKSFPTTAAIICVHGSVATCFWAGDSRCYMLDDRGLHQLSDDDVGGEDALSNLSDDGVLTNVISSSVDFKLHRKDIQLEKPCILFSATDGCFGYLSTPMEFENVLTGSLLSAGSVNEWRSILNSTIRDYTGDDYTMCAAAYGFSSFGKMQSYFAERNDYVRKQFIDSDIDLDIKWDVYKYDYSAYLKKTE